MTPQEVIDYSVAFVNAKTIGDFCEVPFPLIIKPLERPEIFASFHDKVPEDMRRMKVSISSHNLQQFQNEVFQTCCGEVQKIIADHNNDVFAHNTMEKTHKGWETNIIATMSGRIGGHGKVPHIDHPASPKVIMDFIANSEATRVAPHRKIGAILKECGLGPILDLQLDDAKGLPLPETTQAFKLLNFALKGSDTADRLAGENPDYALFKKAAVKICEAMVAMPPNTVFRTAGGGAHFQPAIIAPNRFCLLMETIFPRRWSLNL